jgi:hypothetical protein
VTFQKLLFLISFIVLIVVFAWVTSTAAVAPAKRLLSLPTIPPTQLPVTPMPSEDVQLVSPSSEYGNSSVLDSGESENVSESGGRGSDSIKGRGASIDKEEKSEVEGNRQVPDAQESRNP